MFRSRPHSLRPALAVSVPVLTFLLSILSCSHSTTPSLTPHRESAIAVRTTPAALVVETTAAHFRLLPSGYLQASLLRGGQEWTLDDPAANTSTDFAVIAGKETNEFVLDLDHAKVSAASGRLGGKGKRIEVSGNSSSSPTLEKHVIVEFYDDFPNIALTTVSYKNLRISRNPAGQSRHAAARPECVPSGQHGAALRNVVFPWFERGLGQG